MKKAKNKTLLGFHCLLLAVVVTAKTIDHTTQSSETVAAGGSEHNNQLVSVVGELLRSSLGSPTLDHQHIDSEESVAAQLFSTLRYQLASTQQLTTFLTTTLGVTEDFIKPLIKILDQVEHFQTQQSSLWNSKFNKEEKTKNLYENVDKELFTNIVEGSSNHLLENQESINDKFFNHVKNIFAEEFSGLDIVLRESINGSVTSSNVTKSNMWELVKSTWQRLLAYIEEENSLETFMQLTPVKIIDRIMNIGDEINLINFLATKLDPDFATFLVSMTECYLGPLKDFDTLYNLTKGYGMNRVVDYFISEKFTSTMDMLSRLVSAYLEDRISADLIKQYIDLISFGNVELYNFYISIMNMNAHNSTTILNTNTTQRVRRDILQHITSTFRLGNPQPEDGNQEQLESKPNNEEMNFEGEESRYYGQYQPPIIDWAGILSRDGYGYGGGGHGGGGGGYGSMSGLDPYIALGALALGLLLGFLLFRLLRGTGNGRRDIGDGSLSLWDSDLPHQILPWGSSVDRMKRQVNDDTQSFSLPSSLRGDVWSSDPLVTDNFLDDHLDEDDIAHHLNHLWRLYKDTNETACVHSHLCDVMANSTAHHLTGKDSSLPLIMASVSNLMGVVRSGQLVDHVTQTLVLGQPYSCPSPLPYCNQVI
ncbi:hypothetical protein Pmani_019235 [Petrolisthes manimaculis]|uniref:Uncharacterized protein n=1 Tax=Petrolisthes manimaculis TaxID=1843537 RepID=A0AAE1PKV2_9EUCA|nr:hypothetical protein Pmani_019235 [Petrolisthes manimaculis]